MASSKIMSSSSTSLNSDLSRRPSNFSSTAKPKPTTATAHPSSSSAHPQTQNNSHNSITNSTSLLPIGPMTVGGLLYDSNPTFMIDATLLDTQITLLDTTCAAAAGNGEIELRSVFIRSDSLSPFGSIDKVESCVVVENIGIGLAAAKVAGRKCIATKCGYTAAEGFQNADAVFDFIGDPRRSDLMWDSAEALSSSL